ncbi:MAG TPA: hypothetical protein VLT86_14285 [Vicinamibacterales bacterium]|nr:hypothetical protein [Vicinamibacterales bacterium]
MDVFLVPLGPDRHELYCEPVASEPAPAEDGGARSIWRRVTDTFRRAVKEGEEARHQTAAPHAPPRGRIRRWLTRRLAEAVAEQRLLWRLRTEPAATLIHPDDLAEGRARDLTHASLRSDLDKHRLWCVIDTALAVAAAPLTVIPGPNLPAYYFVFRAVGHFLSMRGAQHGLSGVAWTCRPSTPLTTLRAIAGLDDEARAARVDEVGAALGLEHLARLVEGASARES